MSWTQDNQAELTLDDVIPGNPQFGTFGAEISADTREANTRIREDNILVRSKQIGAILNQFQIAWSFKPHFPRFLIQE